MTTFQRSLLFLLLTFALSVTSASSTTSEAEIKQLVEASSKTRGRVQFWRSDQFSVLFGHDERWEQGTPAFPNTTVVYNWKSKRTGELMATCYLEVLDGGIGGWGAPQVKVRAKRIVDGLVKNSQQRDPSVKLVNWKSFTQDGHPVVYVVRDITVSNLNGTNESRIYSLVTAWKGKEINFECGSGIPRYFPELTGVVEEPIRKVLGSLQFIR